MAEGTRHQSLDEQVKRLAVGVELLLKHRDDVNLKLDAIIKELTKLSAAQNQNNDLIPSSHTAIVSHDRREGSMQLGNRVNQPTESFHGYDAGLRNLEIDFPTFDGNGPREWVRKCECYFQIFGIQEEHKMGIADLHFKDKADVWFSGLSIRYPCLTWKQLKDEVCRRFATRTLEDAVDEFRRLHQSGTVEEYVEKFEELMPLVFEKYPYLDRSYFVDSFIGGLRDEIKAMVRVLKPASVMDALCLARSQEALISVMSNIYQRRR